MNYETQTVLSSYQIEIGIKVELNRLEELNANLISVSRHAAQAETAFKVAYSRARLKAKSEGKITEATADDVATVETEAQRLASALAQNELMSCREGVASAKARLDALRTLSSSSRTNSWVAKKF
jgi:hypothetical protein